MTREDEQKHIYKISMFKKKQTKKNCINNNNMVNMI